MSESKSEDAFDIDGFIKENSFLQGSELYKFYKILDDATLQAHECSTDCLRNKEYEVCELNCHLENIFRKEKNICSSNENIQQKCCDYINYWLYDRLAKKEINLFGIFSIYSKLTNFLEKSQSTIINNSCKDKFKRDTSLEVLKNKKKLYDFSENYDYIKNKLSRVSQDNKEICEYTKYIFKLYNKLNEEDKERGLSHRYKKELAFFKDKFNKDSELTLLKSKCDIDDSLLKSFEDYETSNLLQENLEKNVTRHTKSSSNIEILNNIKNETENKLKQSPSSLIYNELDKEITGKSYNITRCDAMGSSAEKIKPICNKIVRNLNELRTLEHVKDKSLRDRCTYLNFWIYGELSKLYINKNNNHDKNIFDIPGAAELLKAGIGINNDLITEDLNKNLNSTVWTQEPKINKPTVIEGYSSDALNTTSASPEIPANKAITVTLANPAPKGNLTNSALPTSDPNSVPQTSNRKKEPFNIISYKQLSNYEPCFFIYNCKFSECIEMKYLYEYFKNYEYIKDQIKCENGNRGKLVEYLKNISILYNKHKEEEECCSWGETMCPDYFLDCDESYDPKKLLSAIESDSKTCTDIISKAGIANTTEVTFDNAKLDKNMYIKYMTCSYVTDPIFKKKSLICQQPAYSPHLNNKFSRVRPVNMEHTDVSKLKGKELTFSGNSVKAFLISNPKLKITGQTGNDTVPATSEFKTGEHYTLFPEVTGKARKAYLKEGERPCTNKPGEETSEYCKRSKQYTDIINRAILPPEKLIEETQVQTVEDNVFPEDENFFPVDFSSLNEILKNLPFRIGVVILAALGTLAMLFLYYKVH
ncbi:hypothetical protein PVNG_04129 [Plasmodium vivax North Korean]|uniref:VIR protein n=1 Tax=Plasmodium vivax North Korean TaxID=1035514 RepID=A0A0J9TYF8_PLAVI|nr:hypothetical protein PVNG_04129 [Plasmodium vivax North Korean]